MLNLSSRAKYGLVAMFVLAQEQKNKPLQLKTLSEKREIPANYLEQILADLKKSGLVKSFRGAYGGYALAKEASEISINDILISVEGPTKLSGNSCDCAIINAFWKGAENQIKSYFDKTLQELITEKQKSEKLATYAI